MNQSARTVSSPQPIKKSILIHSQHANISPGSLHIISVFIRRHDFGGGGVGGVLRTDNNTTTLLHYYNITKRQPLFSFLLISSTMFYSLWDVNNNPIISDWLLFTFSLRPFSFSIYSFFLYFYSFLFPFFLYFIVSPLPLVNCKCEDYWELLSDNWYRRNFSDRIQNNAT